MATAEIVDSGRPRCSTVGNPAGGSASGTGNLAGQRQEVAALARVRNHPVALALGASLSLSANKLLGCLGSECFFGRRSGQGHGWVDGSVRRDQSDLGFGAGFGGKLATGGYANRLRDWERSWP